MGEKTPLWLDSALDEALLDAGATAPRDVRSAFIVRLTQAWNLAGRSLHNCKYLADIFERLDQLEGATTEPEMLRLAAAFRGALEEPGWEESEELRGPTTFPAPLTADDFRRLGLSQETTERIEELASQLSSHAPADDDLGARILVDADLAALALTPQQYKDFKARLREEAAHMSERDFLTARRDVLTKLLSRRQIFTTPIASKWEDAARENLEAELAGIEAKIARLEAEKPGYMPPSFPPKATTVETGTSPEYRQAPVREKTGTAKAHPRVLRISRSQKAARMANRALPPDGGDDIWESQETAGNDGSEQTRRTPDTDTFVSDTSTLESVADLIEGMKQGTPPPGN